MLGSVEPLRCGQDTHPTTANRVSEHMARLVQDDNTRGCQVIMGWTGVADESQGYEFRTGLDGL